MICKLSVILTDMLENEHIIQTADREVYEYGFQITMANITNALIVLLIGILTDSVIRVLLFYAVFISMRIFSGGFHAKTYTRCFCLFGITCLLCTMSSYGIMHFSNINSVIAISVVLQGFCIYQMAPIENENHPLSAEEKRKFRFYSMIAFVFWLLVMLISSFKGYYVVLAVISVTLISVSILMVLAKKNGGEGVYEEKRA